MSLARDPDRPRVGSHHYTRSNLLDVECKAFVGKTDGKNIPAKNGIRAVGSKKNNNNCANPLKGTSYCQDQGSQDIELAEI